MLLRTAVLHEKKPFHNGQQRELHLLSPLLQDIAGGKMYARESDLTKEMLLQFILTRLPNEIATARWSPVDQTSEPRFSSRGHSSDTDSHSVSPSTSSSSLGSVMDIDVGENDTEVWSYTAAINPRTPLYHYFMHAYSGVCSFATTRKTIQTLPSLNV